MDDSIGILRQMLQAHAKHAEEAEAIGSNNAAWHRNRCRALQAAITALESSPAHTSEARDALGSCAAGIVAQMSDSLDQEVEPELDVIERWRDALESAAMRQEGGTP
jgi:hypothetical protein